MRTASSPTEPAICGGAFDEARLARELTDLETQVSSPDFWKDQAAAQKTLQRRRRLEDDRVLAESLRKQTDDVAVLIDWAKQGEDVATDLEKALEAFTRDVQTGEKVQTLAGEHSGEVYALAFSPDEDGRWIATAGEDSTVKVWDSHTGSLVRNFLGHTGLVTSLAFSPNGWRLYSGSRDTTVKVWDLTQLSD